LRIEPEERPKGEGRKKSEPSAIIKRGGRGCAESTRQT
jgi:hypothetical protein